MAISRKTQKYIPLFLDTEDVLKKLDDSDFKTLILALFTYAKTGEKVQMSMPCEIAFSFMSNSIDRCIELYESRCNENSFNQWYRHHKCEYSSMSEARSSWEIWKNNIEIKDATKSYDCIDSYSNEYDSIEMNTKHTNRNRNRNRNNNKLFDMFWEAYPKKVSKKKAEQIFNKIKPSEDLLQKMLASIKEQKESTQWKSENGQYIPSPTRWLNEEKWNDVLTNNGTTTSSQNEEMINTLNKNGFYDTTFY